MSDELQKQDEKLTSKQKLGLGILSFLGIVALLFGLFQFLYNVKVPFAGRGTGKKTFKTTEEQDLENLLALQSKDTDADGISDFDETYTYKTSPYLEDSDSDGYFDKQEIDSGNDPNCPAGKNCMALESGAVEESGGQESAPAVSLPNFDLGILKGETTPEELRNLLRQQGVSDEALSKIDDKTLMEIYQETLKETPLPEELNVGAGGTPLGSEGAGGTPLGSEGAGGTPSGSIDLSSLSAEEIRALLRQAGVEEELLSSLDDETLRKIFEESIK